MVEATCRLVEPFVERSEREGQPDRFLDLLECLADLRVATTQRRLVLVRLGNPAAARVQTVIEELDGLEGALVTVATRVARVHQELQHERLI
jgi:hypothetical protein